MSAFSVYDQLKRTCSPVKEKTKNKTASGTESRLLNLLKSKKEKMKRQAKNQDEPHAKKQHREETGSGPLRKAHETIEHLEEQIEKKSAVIRCRIMEKTYCSKSFGSPSLVEDPQDPLTERTARPSDQQSDNSEMMVDIGRGLMVKKAAWEYVQCHNKDSLFVKDLLVTVWSKDVLKERSLQGKHCPRFPDRPRKAPLTPWKLDVMRDCYRVRLERQGVPAGVLPLAVKQMNHFIVEKLADIE
ncbi:hypothetical protein MTO96_043709 [Rhipicephalus appendiculatus]